MLNLSDKFRKKDFWQTENLRYSKAHYSLEKCARIINVLSKGKECELLDVGCGPAALAGLLAKNIQYYGIDIAIHDPAPNLIEMDITQNKIGFGGKTFDFVVMRGVLEYLGEGSVRKISEIYNLLKSEGKFVLTYVNFSHLHGSQIDSTYFYNNMKSIREFRKDLEQFFHIDSMFPSSYNWQRSEPNRKWMYKIQMPLELNIPVVHRLFAVQYFFICSLKGNVN